MIMTDSEILEHLDFDGEFPCSNVHGCSRTARWTLTMVCHESPLLLCHECKDIMLTLDTVPELEYINCFICGNQTPPPVVKDIQPL
jgi:hypothetical protein